MGKRQLLKDLLSNMTAFILIYNFFAFFYIMTHGEVPWIHLLLIAPFFFLLFLRKKLWNLPLFLFLHILFIAIPIIFLSGLEMVSMVSFSVICAVYSVVTRMKAEWPIQGSTAVWVIIYLAGIFMLLDVYDAVVPGVSVLLAVSAALILMLTILFVHMENIEFSLAILQVEYKQTTGNILHSNNTVITVFLVIIGFFVILSVFFPVNTAVPFLLSGLWAVVQQILLWIAFAIVTIFSFFLPDITFIEEGVEDVAEVVEEIPEIYYQEQSVFWQILGNILSFIVITILVLLILFALITIIVKLYKAFAIKNRSEDKKSLMPEDTLGKLKFVLSDLKIFLPRFGTGIKHPLRKAYIKKVNGHIKAGIRILESYTPEMIADKIRPEENIDELTQRYEEVRYGRN
ncbi:MAG: hypothetical protein FWE24_08145 [Defluviitaleaceae bacterium]|nr:hypothetical protein [Defluviitaleaceae bacterium]